MHQGIIHFLYGKAEARLRALAVTGCGNHLADALGHTPVHGAGDVGHIAPTIKGRNRQ
ncbi:hypothetical protein SDC9_142895 [bioreactor metagenome]|uniref:Uncharacterized protein n=1 Tax=bioreactor metagenome TaxID=1076179 RepID=A0A645E1V6_9ZZZZ